MAKHHDFLFNIAKIVGDKDYKRHDRRNVLIYHDELKGDSPFDRTMEDREDRYRRLAPFFEGLPVKPVTEYCKRLTRYIELCHYRDSHDLMAHEKLELIDLKERLTIEEAMFPEVAEVLSVDEVESSVKGVAQERSAKSFKSKW